MNKLLKQIVDFVESRPQLQRADYGDLMSIDAEMYYQADNNKVKHQLLMARKLLCKLISIDIDIDILLITLEKYSANNRLKYSRVLGFNYIPIQSWSLEYRLSMIELLRFLIKNYSIFGGTK